MEAGRFDVDLGGPPRHVHRFDAVTTAAAAAVSADVQTAPDLLDIERPLSPADSTGQRNTRIKPFS